MNITILGAGAIGCYIGASLKLGGLNPTLIMRERIKLELEQAKSITLTNYTDSNTSVRLPTLTTDSRALQDADCIILSVKCLSVKNAAILISQYAKPGAVVIPLQNGIGSEESLFELCKQQKIVRGVVGFNVSMQGNGHFLCGTEGSLYCEDSLPDDVRNTLTTALAANNIPLHCLPNFEALRWAKLQLNLNNAINALSNLPLKSELEKRAYRQILAGAMREMLLITKAKKLTLPKLTNVPAWLIPYVLNMPDFIFKRIAKSILAIDPKAHSSMWDDLTKDRQTEIDFINGAILQEARSVWVYAPINERLVDLIRKREGQPLEGLKAHEIWKFKH